MKYAVPPVIIVKLTASVNYRDNHNKSFLIIVRTIYQILTLTIDENNVKHPVLPALILNCPNMRADNLRSLSDNFQC